MGVILIVGIYFCIGGIAAGGTYGTLFAAIIGAFITALGAAVFGYVLDRCFAPADWRSEQRRFRRRMDCLQERKSADRSSRNLGYLPPPEI
jgi:hypothetical protein